MQIKLHGIFAQDYGAEHRIEAKTVAEAIEGFTRQVGFYTDRPIEQRPVMAVVGHHTLESLIEEKELNEVHLVPAMIGGGGVGKIVIGAALIAIALTNPFGWAFLATAAVASAVVSIGVTLVLSGVMQLFMKAPEVGKNSDPEASKYMGLGDNTVAIGTPIPIQYGRGPATGHLLAVNVDSSDFVLGQFPATPT
jgi:predicted phage tail protein